MFDVIHAFGSAYGWDKETILSQVFPDEIEPFLTRIKRDEANKNLILLAIAHNPHTKDPNKLIKSLQSQLGKNEAYYTKDVMDEDNTRKLKAVRGKMAENAKKKRAG